VKFNFLFAEVAASSPTCTLFGAHAPRLEETLQTPVLINPFQLRFCKITKLIRGFHTRLANRPFFSCWLLGTLALKVDENYKWSVSQLGIESLSYCPHFGTLGKNRLFAAKLAGLMRKWAALLLFITGHQQFDIFVLFDKFVLKGRKWVIWREAHHGLYGSTSCCKSD